MTVRIPLDPIPWQTLSVSLGGHACEIEVRQIGARLYASLKSDGVVICQNVLCACGGKVNLYPHPSFTGRLYWADTAGSAAPQHEGLGTRWQLLYDEGE